MKQQSDTQEQQERLLTIGANTDSNVVQQLCDEVYTYLYKNDTAGKKPSLYKIQERVKDAIECDEDLILYTKDMQNIFWFRCIAGDFTKDYGIFDVICKGNRHNLSKAINAVLVSFVGFKPKSMQLSAIGVERLESLSRLYRFLGFKKYGVVNSKEL